MLMSQGFLCCARFIYRAFCFFPDCMMIQKTDGISKVREFLLLLFFFLFEEHSSK